MMEDKGWQVRGDRKAQDLTRITAALIELNLIKHATSLLSAWRLNRF
jgi:hypothetical protein